MFKFVFERYADAIQRNVGEKNVYAIQQFHENIEKNILKNSSHVLHIRTDLKKDIEASSWK